jgi:hypothetical protein
MSHPRPHCTPLALSLIAAAALAACGGGSQDDPPTPAATLLQGTAAIGAPMAGATITVTDSDPATPDPAAVTADAQGRFSVDVGGQVAPLLLRARGSVDGEIVSHAAVVPTVTAQATGTANVTPMTTAVAVLSTPAGDLEALATPATLAAAGAAVASATQLLVATLASDDGTAALLPADFDPLSTPFAADGTGADAVLHRVAIRANSGTVSLNNLAAAAGDGGSPPPVTLTAATSTPPRLPQSMAADDLPTAADLATLGARWQACLALPVAERVTRDASGTVTAVLGACNFTVADWRSNGRSFKDEVGQFTLTENTLTGARIGAGSVVLALSPQGHTDPKVFRHPYCNDSPCAVVRWPLVTASGRPTTSDWVLGKVDGRWDFVGNQRPYRLFVEARLNRKLNVNRDGPAAGNAAHPYFFQDRHESLLRLIFDLSTGDTADVRAVRWTGPGLPAAGVVQVRSQRCGTDDRMGITNQVGSTRVIGGSSHGALQWWTSGSSAEFVLGAVKPDGTVLETPLPANTDTSAGFQDFSPVRFDDLTAAVPSWSVYKVEVFHFSSNSDVPDQVVYLRIATGPENPSAGPAVAWPTLDPAIAEARLKPGAAEVMDFASVLNWTVPEGSYVTSGYLFGQDFQTASNGEDAAATYALRGRVDYRPAAYGDATATGWRLASPVAGTALSPNTESIGSNPNPRCGTARLPALTGTTSDYREIGIFTRSADRQLRQAIWFWDN